MSDLFHEEAPFEFIDKVFAVMAVAGNHVFQVLTKRPEIMLEYTTQLRDGKRRLGDALVAMNIDSYIKRLCIARAYGTNDKNGYDPPYQPFPNVWLGVSVENQQTANERIPLLLQCLATVRFLSCEPLLGEIDFKLIRPDFMCAKRDVGVDWVICGGESGPNFREMKPEWARSIRDQCQISGIPFFFKQWSGIRPKEKGRLLDGQQWNEYPKELVY